MSSAENPQGTPVQQPLAELLAGYLREQAEAQAAGLVADEPSGEVVPFEAAPVQAVDPRLAWKEALEAARFFVPEAKISWKVPPDWPTVVTVQEPAVAIAFAMANFPQLVRHVQPLLQRGHLAGLRPSAGRSLSAPALAAWAEQTARKKQYPETLLALGALRLARHFDAANDLLNKYRVKAPAEWQPALANEEAALAWHAGRGPEAAALWAGQAESVPVLFNRGMSALFLDQPAQARAALNEAIVQLPEESAWHHLGRLYLALAEIRG